MNINNFIKKCIPFADGFEMKGNEIDCLGNIFFTLEEKYFKGNLWQKFFYPHLLTRTIEGINKKHLNDDKYPTITIDAYDIEVRFKNPNIEDFIKSLANWNTINEAKIAAIEYIFEQVNL